LCAERLAVIPAGSAVVVRALAAAGDATYAELGADLDRCLQRATSIGVRDRDARPGTVS
jgi:ribonuclease P protein component